jgi:hypothetical protein
MTPQEVRAHYNFLLTLYIRKAETFGPLAFAFVKDHGLETSGLTPEEQFTLYTAIAEAFADEPKRYTHKLDCLQKAVDILPQTGFFDPGLSRQIHQDILRLRTELDLYTAAMKPERAAGDLSTAARHIIIETDMPDYFLTTAQQRASTYYQAKFRLTKESKIAQHFSGPTRQFEPETTAVHKEFPGACAPFVFARTGAWHVMLPFDLKISRTPEDPLDAGLRIWYAKIGYSFPLRYEMGRLCSYYDDQVLEIEMNDPHLLFVSVSPLKERDDLGTVDRTVASDVPFEIGLPRAFLDGTNTLGPYVQISCNIKVWFDAAAVNLLVQGAPDLHEYGVEGGAGLLTRTYASEKTAAYAGVGSRPWQQGLSFNFVNMHLQLLPDVTTAVIPANTPIFSLYPTVARGQFEMTDARSLTPP